MMAKVEGLEVRPSVGKEVPTIPGDVMAAARMVRHWMKANGAIELCGLSENGLTRALTNAEELFGEIERAREIISGLTQYRERLLTRRMESTPEMVERIRELATPFRDDFDRAVMCAVHDLEALQRDIAQPL